MSNEVAIFSEFETNLTEYKERYDGVLYDLTKDDDNKQARSDRLAIGKVISRLDTAHKNAKAPLKEKVDLIDGERKRIKDCLLLVQGGIKIQIAEHEAKIQAHEDALMVRIDAIKELQVFDMPMTVDLVTERLEAAKALVIDESYDHFEKEAVFARVKVIEYLEPVLVGLIATEKAAAEEERQREEQAAAQQKLREKQIARDAAAAAEVREAAAVRAAEAAENARKEAEEKAKIDAENAAIDAATAAEEAEYARQEAEKQAKIDAEKAQAAAVQAAEDAAKAEADRVEKERQRQIQADKDAAKSREADKEHRGKINREAVSKLCEIAGTSEETARAVITAIAKGEIPAVKISY